MDDLPTSYGAMNTGGSADDDEFGGFETAEPVNGTSNGKGKAKGGILDDFDFGAPVSAPAKTTTASLGGSWADFGSAPMPSSGPSMGLAPPPGSISRPAPTPSSLPPPLASSSLTTAKPAGGDPFAQLFDLSASALAPKTKNEPKAGPSLNSLPANATATPTFAAFGGGGASSAPGDSLI
jgi:hypothetical protein